ncbi:kinase-associated lipoprotein B [Bacillus timonensis]|nr:kinase-associated lipoprotein B [Bacillus timonensis]
MNTNEIEVGSVVTGIYKTGKYIGEVTAIRPQHYLVKVKAVVKHPTQGDLHNPKQVDVPLFHERRALACHEQTNIPKNMVHVYNGEIPSYQDSLKTALDDMKLSLEKDNSEWAKRCLENIYVLEKDYFKN